MYIYVNKLTLGFRFGGSFLGPGVLVHSLEQLGAEKGLHFLP